MAVRIASNISSLQSQRSLSEATAALGKVSERVSSGLRINRAADDAAGLQIAEGLRSDGKVYGQAVRNVNDGLSLLNIAQGAVQELSSIVTRQSELAEQAANGTYSYKQRQAMNAEANALVKEYNRIVQTTSFNGTQTLAGVTNTLRMQLGYGVNGGIDIGAGNQIGFAAGNATFSAVGSYATGATPTTIATADFNGDGLIDIVVADGSDSTLRVRLGNGDGSFLVQQTLAAGLSTNRINVSDVNDDGIGDIVALNSTDTTVSVFFGNSDGTFQSGRSYSSGIGYQTLSMADLNGDGVKDVVLGGFGTSIGILYGNSNGTFRARTTIVTPSSGNWGGTGDSNGDGIADLMISHSAVPTVGVLLGNGNGTFLAEVTFNVGNSPTTTLVGDFNGDGVQDIVTADQGDGKVSILIGNGNGTFLARRSYALTFNPYSLGIGDFNGDGISDIAASTFLNNTVDILIGNGNGTFRAVRSIATSRSVSVGIGDVNGDGISDIVSADRLNAVVNVLVNAADSTGRRNNLMDALDLSDKYHAKQALMSSKAALVRIGAELGGFGAMQSRLSVATQTLQLSRENFDSARSQLVDADIAAESATLVSTRLRQQAAAGVLAQANQQPSLALRLLGK